MDTYFVKDFNIITFCLHPEKSHIYYLTEKNDKNKQYVIEEDMLTFNIINKFEAIEEPAKINDPYGYSLHFYKKKSYLFLTYPSSLITIWDTNSKTLVFKSYALKKPLERITTLALCESSPLMVFSIKSQTRLFVTNINEAISSEPSASTRKLKLSRKVIVNDLKCHPIDAKCVAACSDGIIRVWDLTGLNVMTPILEGNINVSSKKLASLKSTEIIKLNLPAVTCVSFSPDGTKLLSCNQQGKVLCWDVTNLGEEFSLLASIRVSPRGVLSVSWLNYNGDYRSTRLICYTQEGNIKSLELERTSEKRPDKKGVVWSLKELENIYHTKGEIDQERIEIEPYLPNFLRTHPFSNLVVVNTIKEKKFLKDKTVQLKFSLNIKVLVIFDKFDHLLDYPKIAPGVHVPLNQALFPPNQRNLTYQKDIFYIEDGTLTYLDLSTGKKEIVSEFLKTPQLSDVIRTTKFEMRPITLNHISHSTFLINFEKEKLQVLLIAHYNSETSPPTFKLHREMPCSMSLFLGDLHLQNPPIFILMEDRMTYMVNIDDPSRLDEETKKNINVEAIIRDNLNVKIKKVYWTPFRNGYVLLYQSSYDNLLRFSMNRLPTNDILDFKVLTTDYVYKTQYDEDVFDVVWQAKSGLVEKERYLGAVISWNKITVINENLKPIATIKIPYFNIKTNMLVNAFWFGFTLFYYTKNHLFYSTVSGKSNCICSFDNYSYKNQILAIMNDRVVFGSKPNILNSKQARQPKYKMEIRFRPIVLSEPIILGYLSLSKIYPNFTPDYNVIKQNLLLIETAHLSSELIKGLNEHKLFNASWFILKNQNYLQFSLEERVKLLNKLGQFDKFFEILFPGKSITDEGDVSEMISNIITNPVFYVEKKLIQNQAEVFLNFGEFTKAVYSYDLLQEYQKISAILNALDDDKWAKTFATRFIKENNHKIFNYNLRAALLIQAGMMNELIEMREKVKAGNHLEKCEFKIRDPKSYGTTIDLKLNDVKLIDNLKILLPKKLPEAEQQLFNKIQSKYKLDGNNVEEFYKLSIPFGETPYSFLYTPAPGSESVPKFTEIFSMTPYQFLGYNCLEMDETKKKNGGDFEGMEQGDAKDDEELGSLSLYWRFDEGKGVNIENILGNNLTGVVEFKGGADPQENFWIPLEDGDPMELEDKWGKKCPPQFAIHFKPELISVKSTKKSWCPSNLTKFTLELWLKPKSENGVILEIGQGNFAIGFQNLEFSLQMKNAYVTLTAETKEMLKDEGDDEEPGADRAADEEMNKIKTNFWNHIAIVYDNSQPKKLAFYLNCVLVASSELNIPGELFKDQTLYLGKEKLHAEMTEVRFWTSALSLSEIKEQHRMPLEIVYEKKKEIKVKFKTVDKDKKSAIVNLPKPGGGLPAPTGMGLGLRPPPNTGILAPEGLVFGVTAKATLPLPEDNQAFSSFTDKSPAQRTGFGSGPRLSPPPDIQEDTSIRQNKQSGFEDKEEEKSHSRTRDRSKERDAGSFSNFDTYNRDKNDFGGSFDKFNSKDAKDTKDTKVEEPTSFDNFGFQSSPASNFNAFSDFNTASGGGNQFDTFSTPSQNAKFDEFGKWDSTNQPSAPTGGLNDFGNFDSFGQNPKSKETKSDDFSNFNSFEGLAKKSHEQNDHFGDFSSFNAKSKIEEPKEAPGNSGFGNFNRESVKFQDQSTNDFQRNSETGSKGSEERRRKPYEEGNSDNQGRFEMAYSGGGAPDNQDMSFAQGINMNDVTFNSGNQEDDYRKQLSRPKGADQKQLKFVDSIYQDLTTSENVDKNAIIKAKEVWVKMLDLFQKAEITTAVEAIDQGISILRKQCQACSQVGDKVSLRKVQRLIILLGRYRLGTQLMTCIQDLKSKETMSLRKLCFLHIILYSLKLIYATNPLFLIETAELNLKAKNYKIANQVYQDLLNSDYYELSQEQKEKISKRIEVEISLEDLPKENNTLNKMNCPSCNSSFGFEGEYTCPNCSKDFILCYQTLNCIDEESSLKCNACHACFSKSAKQLNEKCSVCRVGALCSKNK